MGIIHIAKTAKIQSIVKKLLKEEKFHEANWFLTKQMNRKQNIEYAKFAAGKIKQIDLRMSVRNNVDTFGFYINNFKVIEASEFALSIYDIALSTFSQTQKESFTKDIVNFAINIIKNGE